MRRLLTFAAPLVATLLISCGGDEGSSADEPAVEPPPATPAVTIVAPQDGSEVPGPSVTVVLAASNFEVVPAGDMTPNSGHHHLFLDRDVSDPSIPIPAEEGFIAHIGTGAAEFTFENVAPGEHRLIAVVGDALHVPVQPLIVDTIRFTVR